MTACGCGEPDAVTEAVQSVTESTVPDTKIIQPTTPDLSHCTTIQVPPALSSGLKHAIVVGSYFGASRRLGNQGLPKNTRQTEEGYWLGSRPNALDIEEFHARGVQLVLTLSVIPRRELATLQETIQRLGMKHIYLPFGSKFPASSKFMPDVMSYRPEQILIHCEHGSDRTGAMIAFILAARHGWPIQKALFSAILPSTSDINALSRILQSRGYAVNTEEFEPIIGMYSAEKNGGYGGMKVRTDGGNYYRLVESTITRREAFEQP